MKAGVSIGIGYRYRVPQAFLGTGIAAEKCAEVSDTTKTTLDESDYNLILC